MPIRAIDTETKFWYVTITCFKSSVKLMVSNYHLSPHRITYKNINRENRKKKKRNRSRLSHNSLRWDNTQYEKKNNSYYSQSLIVIKRTTSSSCRMCAGVRVSSINISLLECLTASHLNKIGMYLRYVVMLTQLKQLLWMLVCVCVCAFARSRSPLPQHKFIVCNASRWTFGSQWTKWEKKTNTHTDRQTQNSRLFFSSWEFIISCECERVFAASSLPQ